MTPRILFVALIAVANCGIFYVLSLGSAMGDNAGGHLPVLWLVGYSWIALLTLVAVGLVARGKASVGYKIAAAPIPFALLFLYLWLSAKTVFAASIT